MKRFLLLLALFVLFLSASATFDHWSPWLRENLGESTTSATIQAIDSALEIAFKLATLGLGIAVPLGWRAKSPNAESVPPAKRESDPTLLQDPAYEPTLYTFSLFPYRA